MRFILWLATITVSAVLIAWLLTINHGHVTLYWDHFRTDLSMNLFLIIGFIVFLAIFYFFRAVTTLIDLPSRAKQYRAKQLELRSFQELKNAMEYLFAGRYLKSLKSAQHAMHFKDTAQVSYMVAAQASHHLKQYDERDQLLEKIGSDESSTAKAILKAQMLIDERRAEEALEVLSHIQQKGSRQFIVQALSMRVYQILGQWPQMLRLANSLSKKNYLPPLLGRARVHEALTQWVKSGNASAEDLLKQWNDFGQDGQNNPQWVKLFAHGLISAGDYAMAKNILDHQLDFGANEELLAIYPECGIPIEASILRTPMMQKLEDWLSKDPANPSIHLALGKLCQADKLWGKSLVSLQTVLDSPRSTVSMRLVAELGMMRVYDALDNQEKSAAHQEEALRLFTKLYPQY
jgi:HemY protein